MPLILPIPPSPDTSRSQALEGLMRIGSKPPVASPHRLTEAAGRKVPPTRGPIPGLQGAWEKSKQAWANEPKTDG